MIKGIAKRLPIFHNLLTKTLQFSTKDSFFFEGESSQSRGRKLIFSSVSREDLPKMRAIAFDFLRHYQNKYMSTVSDEGVILRLLQIPLLYEYNSKSYWKELDSLITSKADVLTINTKLSILKLMRTFKTQNLNSYSSIVGQLLMEIEKLKPEEIIQVALALCNGPEMISHHTKKLIQDLIVKNVSSIPVPLFCELFENLVLTEIPMKEVLSSAVSHIIKNIDKVPKSALWTVIAAYGEYTPSEFLDISRVVEERVMTIFPEFTLREITGLLYEFSRYGIGTEPLFLAFEKEIGKNIDLIEHKDVGPILEAFVNRGFYREKLLAHFIKKVKACAHLFSLKEMASIVEAYTKANTNYEIIYQTLEPYIISKKHESDSNYGNTAFRIIYGFSNPNLKQKGWKVYDELEDPIMKYVQGSSVDTLVRIIYGYSLMSKGSKEFLEKVLLKIQENVNSLDSQVVVHFLSLVKHYNLPEPFVTIVKGLIENHIKKFSKDEIKEITEIALEDPRLKNLIYLIPKI